MRNSLFSVFLILFAGCGKDDSEFSLEDPNVIDGEDRSKYCFVRTAHEDDANSLAFLDSIRGTWDHYPKDSNAGFRRREFILDMGRRIAAVTTYYSLGKNVEDIGFHKICVSKPIESGGYAGYRLVEMMAVNNEGGAAVLIRMEPSGALLVSDRYYRRQAAGGLYSLDEVLRGVGTVWKYPSRH